MVDPELPSTDEPDNIVLKRLREIRGMLGEILADTSDTRLRVGMLEGGYASVSVRLDRIAADVARIERRLGLVEGAAP